MPANEDQFRFKTKGTSSCHDQTTNPMNERKQAMYAGLGHLFYSIAASDGHVAQEESDKVKKLVRSQWMPLEPAFDSVGTDLAYYIEIGFDHAHAASMSADAAFNKFREVAEEHAEEFDPSTRNMVTRAAKAVADTFDGKSKEEKKVLERLAAVFK